MPTKEALIQENQLLQARLALAEKWMRREIASHRQKIEAGSVKKSQRKKLDNILEQESVDIITRRIESYFRESLARAPKFTLEHLIDAEIYWQTLQKFPTLDALPVVSSYQKVLDAFFERILEGFRARHREVRSDPVLQNPGLPRRLSQIQIHSSQGQTQVGFDKDIQNVLEKKYTLSLGRWYQFFEKIRNGDEFGGTYEDLLLEYMNTHHEPLLEMCVTDPFFRDFSLLIELEVFGRKRHDAKISYRDARKVREILVGNYENEGLLRMIF